MLEAIYARAASAQDLPWHSARVPDALTNVVRERGRKGRALDIGCGAGAHAAFLAQNGYQVTGIDYVRDALQFARQQAEQARVDIELVHADFLTWRSPVSYSLIIDAGCLHGIWGRSRERYRSQLLSMLDADGDYILLHVGKKHAFDWLPVGPRRIGRHRIVTWLSPELKEHAYTQTRRNLRFPIVRDAVVGAYWFKWADTAARRPSQGRAERL
jgi:SAM-dependent methyltransferase